MRRLRMRLLRSQRGSAPAEFAMVGALLTVLLLAVVQLTVTLLVRNTLRDAAAEGARTAALAGSDLHAGVARTRQLAATALGAGYARRVSARLIDDGALVEVRVVAPLPALALIGVPDALEVTGHAAVETLGDGS